MKKNKFAFRLNKVKKIFMPTKLIVFIGVDGSGKTTLIDELGKISSTYKAVVYLGWKDYFFKFVGKLDRKIYFSNKITQSVFSRVQFFLFHLFLPFDFWARYLKAKMQTKEGIIVADRYPLPKKQKSKATFLPIQKIYRNIFLHLTYFLLPKPAIIFILTGEPKTIWERKKEMDYKRFLYEFKRCSDAKNLFNCKTVEVNTDCPIENSFNKIYQKIKCLK